MSALSTHGSEFWQVTQFYSLTKSWLIANCVSVLFHKHTHQTALVNCSMNIILRSILGSGITYLNKFNPEISFMIKCDKIKGIFLQLNVQQNSIHHLQSKILV